MGPGLDGALIQGFASVRNDQIGIDLEFSAQTRTGRACTMGAVEREGTTVLRNESSSESVDFTLFLFAMDAVVNRAVTALSTKASLASHDQTMNSFPS